MVAYFSILGVLSAQDITVTVTSNPEGPPYMVGSVVNFYCNVSFGMNLSDTSVSYSWSRSPDCGGSCFPNASARLNMAALSTFGSVAANVLTSIDVGNLTCTVTTNTNVSKSGYIPITLEGEVVNKWVSE